MCVVVVGVMGWGMDGRGAERLGQTHCPVHSPSQPAPRFAPCCRQAAIIITGVAALMDFPECWRLWNRNKVDWWVGLATDGWASERVGGWQNPATLAGGLPI